MSSTLRPDARRLSNAARCLLSRSRWVSGSVNRPTPNGSRTGLGNNIVVVLDFGGLRSPAVMEPCLLIDQHVALHSVNESRIPSKAVLLAEPTDNGKRLLVLVLPIPIIRLPPRHGLSPRASSRAASRSASRHDPEARTLRSADRGPARWPPAVASLAGRSS